MSRTGLTTVVIVALLLCAALLGGNRPAQADGEIFFVDANMSGSMIDGRSWETAYLELQSALAVATSGDEIWVAEGVYKPDFDPETWEYTGWVTATFRLPEGVALYGGFAGGEETRDERDWHAHVTVLSGDFDDDDDPDEHGVVVDPYAIVGPNALTVVRAENVTQASVLDGFTVTAGDAVTTGIGGGMFVSSNASPTIRNTRFGGNRALQGGGMHTLGTPTLSDVVFENNLADSDSYSNGGEGGGLYITTTQPVTLVNVVFSGNEANYYGGGMYDHASPLTLANAVFGDNEAMDGSAVYNHSASPRLVNVTLSHNRAYFGDGTVYNAFSSPALSNCIVWGNTGGQIVDDNSTSQVSYSLVEGGYPGEGNLDVDPQFVDAIGGDFHLYPSSLAVDAGDVMAVPSDTLDLDGDGVLNETLPFDVSGRARIAGTRVDMGAYERVSYTLYVDTDALGLTPAGLSWTSAFTELQSALSVAIAGDEVWVAEGTYKPDFDPVSSRYTGMVTATFLLDKQMILYGGFAGTESALGERDWRAHPTILSGDIGTLGSTGDNVYNVVTARGVTETTRLDGFTITGGNALGGGGDPCGQDRAGGGIYNDLGNPTLVNLIVRNNKAENGGGMLNYRGSPVLLNAVFDGNISESSMSGGGGGLMNCESGSALVANSVFIRNKTRWYGGGVLSYRTDTRIVNVTFYANTADNGGSNVASWTSNDEMINSIIWGSSGSSQIVKLYSAALTVSHSLVQGGYSGEGNIDADPLFANAPGGDLRLRHNSPAADAGDANVLPADVADLDGDGDTSEPLPLDLGGSARVIGPGVNMGAYEGQIPFTRYLVDADAPGPVHDGLTWTTAYTELQSALSAMPPGDEIWVAEGTYKPDFNPTQGVHTGWVTATFLVDKQMVLYGGFAGTESALEERDWAAHPTILSGDVGTVGSAGDNVRKVVTIRSALATIRLDGFTITGGYTPEYVLDYGCGIYNDSGSPTLANLHVIDNHLPDGVGGGMYNSSGSPTLLNVTFENNTARWGGGMASSSGSLTLLNVVFKNNSAAVSGGGMSAGGSLRLLNVVFDGNSAAYAGGLHNSASSAMVINSVFTRNKAWWHDSSGGGGVYNRSSNARFVNVTFYTNTTNFVGRSMFNDGGAPEIVNCIMWGGSGEGQIYNDSASPTVRDSLVEGGYSGGVNVLDLDPQFVDASGGNLRLRHDSPAIDAGDTTAVPTDTLDLDGDGVVSETLPFDLDGSPRVIGGQVDMGAYELKIGAVSDPDPGVWYDFRPDVCAQVYFSNVGSLPTAVTVTLMHVHPTVNGTGLARRYEITTSGGDGFAAQVMLCYEDEELVDAGIDPALEANLDIYRYAGEFEWQAYSEVDVVNNLITATGVTEFGVFGIGVGSGNHPTSVALRGLAQAAGHQPAAGHLPAAVAAAIAVACVGVCLAGALRLRRRERR